MAPQLTAALAFIVHGLGDQFFARTAFADDQDRKRSTRDALDLAIKILHDVGHAI
jgi:hypothetical protein